MEFNSQSGASVHIKIAMLKKGVSSGQLSEALGYSSPQVFRNKLFRNSMTFTDAEVIADALDCDLIFLDRKTKEAY